MSKSKFNYGDIVMVVDGAWGRVLNCGSVDSPLKRPEAKNKTGGIRKFKILAINCAIPVVSSCVANTLIQALDDNTVIAINDCNLFTEPTVEVKFISNGRDVTDSMSNQSKQAILRANNLV